MIFGFSFIVIPVCGKTYLRHFIFEIPWIAAIPTCFSVVNCLGFAESFPRADSGIPTRFASIDGESHYGQRSF